MPLFTVSTVDLQTRTIHVSRDGQWQAAITFSANMFAPGVWVGSEGYSRVADSPEDFVARYQNEFLPIRSREEYIRDTTSTEMVVTAVDTVNRTVTIVPDAHIPEGQAYLTTASGTSPVHNFTTADTPWRTTLWDISSSATYDRWASSQTEINRLYSTIAQDSMLYGTAAVKFSWENMTSLEKEIYDIQTMGYKD